MIGDVSWQPGMGYAISRFGTADMKPGMEIGDASTKPGSRDLICDATQSLQSGIRPALRVRSLAHSLA